GAPSGLGFRLRDTSGDGIEIDSTGPIDINGALVCLETPLASVCIDNFGNITALSPNSLLGLSASGTAQLIANSNRAGSAALYIENPGLGGTFITDGQNPDLGQGNGMRLFGYSGVDVSDEGGDASNASYLTLNKEGDGAVIAVAFGNQLTVGHDNVTS